MGEPTDEPKQIDAVYLLVDFHFDCIYSNLFNEIVVGGIGGGALNGLLRMGLKVYRAAEGSVAINVDLFLQGMLPELTPQQTCGGHAHGGGCSH